MTIWGGFSSLHIPGFPSWQGRYEASLPLPPLLVLSLYFFCVSKVGPDSQLWEGRKEVLLTSLTSAQILNPDSCGREATWASARQVAGEGGRN